MDIKENIDETVLKSIKNQKKTIKADIDTDNVDQELLDKCAVYWDALSTVRSNRARTRNYLLGDQWGDLISDPDNPRKQITEEQHIENNGGVALKQNMMRMLDKALKGQYHQNPSKSTVIARVRDKQKVGEMLNCAIEYVKQINDCSDKDIKAFGEFGLSGITIQKVLWDNFSSRDKKDIRVKNVATPRIFFNTDIEENNGEDLNLIGQIIDIDIEDLLNTFAHSENDEIALRDIYKESDDEKHYYAYADNLDKGRTDNLDFYVPYEQNKCRIYEVWYKKGEWRMECHDFADASWVIRKATAKDIDAENQQRVTLGLQAGIPQEEIKLIEYTPIFERIWYVKYLTPLGQVILEMESPYLHQEHPFAFYAYPLIDGKTSGFLQDSIDQQRQINRVLILWDMAMSASIKGLMMVPEDSVPTWMKPEEYAVEIKKFNGVIFYKPNMHGKIPEHVAANSVPAGMGDLLSVHMKLLNDISGAGEALRGQAPAAGTPAASYAQQAQNSSTNILDYMKSFGSFIKVRDTKVLKLITQYYKEPRFLAVAGRSFSDDIKEFDPEAVKDLETDIVVNQANDAPIFRTLMEQQLQTLLEGQFITILQYLEHSSMPYADKLAETIKNAQAQMQQQQMAQQIPPDQLQQMGGGNPKAMQLLQQGINN